jgi:hypothetical protein
VKWIRPSKIKRENMKAGFIQFAPEFGNIDAKYIMNSGHNKLINSCMALIKKMFAGARVKKYFYLK